MKNVENKLRVVHYPQLGVKKSFEVEVDNEREAYLTYNTLADQHLWLFENKFIPDYSNVILIQMYCTVEGDWVDYYNEHEQMDWDEFKDEYLEESI